MAPSGLIKSNKWRFALILLLLIFEAGLNTVSGYSFKPATDHLIKGKLGLTFCFLIIMVGSGIASAILDAVAQTMYSRQV